MSLQDFLKGSDNAIKTTLPKQVPNTGSLSAFLGKTVTNQSIAAPVSQPEENTGLKGFLKSAGGFVKDVAIGGIKSLAQTAARFETNQPFIQNIDRSYKMATGKTLIPEKVSLPILGETSIKYKDIGEGGLDKIITNAKELAGQVGEDVLNVATAGEGSILAAGTKQVIKQGLKETSKKIAKEGLKQIVKKVAKQGVKDFLIGSGFGATAGLQRKDSTPEDIVKEALLSGSVMTIATPVLGSTLSAVFKTLGFAKRQTAKVIEKTAVGLEKIATKDTVEQTSKITSEQFADSGPRFFEHLDTPTPSTKQKIAGKLATGIRTIQKVPSQIKNQINRWAPVGRFQEKANEAGIATGDLEDMVQAAKYRADEASNRLDYYVKMREIYGEDWQLVKEATRYLDSMDRIGNGDKITGGLVFAGAQHNLDRLMKSLSPERQAKVKDGLKEMQQFLNDELMSAVDSGRLSQQGYRAIKEAHPNYIPHDVLDYQMKEADAQQMLPRSMTQTKSGIEATKGGSEKEIEDIDNAIVNRLYRNRYLSEKNKAMSAIIETGKQMGEGSGFSPLRTAEQVTERENALKELVALREEMFRIKESLSISGSEDKILIKKMNQLNEEMDDLSQKAIDVHLGADPDEIARVRNIITIKEDASKGIKQAAKETKGAAEESLILDTKTKDRVRVLNQDISEAERDVAKTRVAYEAKKVAAADGATVTFKSEENAYNKAQDKLFTRLQEKAHTLKMSETIFVGSPKQKPIIKATQKTVIPAAKKAIETNIIKGKNNDIEILKNRIAVREEKLAKVEADKLQSEKRLDMLVQTFKDKKEQIGSTLDDIRANADIKMRGKDVPEGFEKVSYFKNGIREDWLVPADLGRALKDADGKIASAIMNFLQHNFIGKMLTAPAKLTRYLATGINPVFALFSNPARDIQTVQMTFGKITPKDYAVGLWHAITGGKMQGNEDFYRFARKSGALQGSIFRENLTPEQLFARSLEKRGLLSKITSPARLVEEGGQRMEEMTRLMVFKKALQNGAPPMEAAKFARNATVDFGKHGDFLQIANQVIPFLNARVQGFSNLAGALAKDPTRVIRAGFITAAMPATMLNAYNSNYDSYHNIPENEKRLYWIIMVGETLGRDQKGKQIKVPHYVKIPKGEAQQAIAAVADKVLEYGKEKNPESTGKFLRGLIESTSPITESSLIPEGWKQWLETSSNYSWFRKKQIEPDYIKVGNKYKPTSDVPRQYRTKEGTSEIAKGIGETLGWSPIKIDYVIKNGLMTDIINAYDLASQGKELEGTTTFDKAAKLPFIRSIIGNSSYAGEVRKREAAIQKAQEKNTRTIERLRQKE